MEIRRPRTAEVGLFLIIVAAPLVVTPFSAQPFADPKLLVVAAGGLCLWISLGSASRRLLAVGGIWIAATAIAAILGVDPVRSLTAPLEPAGGGLLLTGTCVAVAIVGAAVPDDLARAGARMALGAGLAVAAVGLVVRLFPSAPTAWFPGGSSYGGTMGNPIFAIAIVSIAAAALIDVVETPRRRALALVVLAAGAASFAQRSGYVLPVAALVVTLWRARVPLRQAALLVAVLAGVLVGWIALEPALPERAASGGVAQLTDTQNDASRLIVWRTSLRGWTEHPLVGWGPGSTQTAYLRGATPRDLAAAGRRWADAHDLPIEQLVTTGVVGAAAFLLFAALVARRAWRGPRVRAWALGGAASLLVYAAVEPVHVVLTPLLFLLAGLAAGEPAGEASPAPRWARASLTGLLSLTVAFAVMNIAASTAEHWGRHYGEVAAFRTSLAIWPWRLSASEGLAFRLTTDGRNDPVAAADARAAIRDAVARHPWDANVRLRAADVEVLLGDLADARPWVLDQVDRFPADARVLEIYERRAEGIVAPPDST